MKALRHVITLLFALLVLPVSAAEGWVTELDEAKELAKKDGKDVMIEFTGSDWCPPCKMMHKKVFSKKEFVDGASKDFVLCKIDLKRSDKELYKKNSKVMKQFKVRGVPTVILLDSEGKEYSRFGASRYPSVEQFLGQLTSEKGKKGMD